MSTPKAVKSILSLEKALHILEIMANNPAPARLLDIAKQAELPTSTALRLLSTLQANGYVNQEPESARYYPTLKLYNLGSCILNSFPLVDIAKPYLRRLADETSHSINLSILQNDRAVLIDMVDCYTESQTITTYRGRAVPLYCSALGRAFLTGFSAQELDEYFRRTKLEAYTPITLLTTERIIHEVSLARQRGYAYEPGELRSGIAGIGAPICNARGEVIAAISLAELSSVMTLSTIELYGAKIQKTAMEISAVI